jgi:alpha-L-arabinofuranosidase
MFRLKILILVCLLTIGATTNAQHEIAIDAGLAGERISPQLFGHNLEHTRKSIWQGISAEMVANRKFAAADYGLPMRWHTLNGKGVSLDTLDAFVGSHSVRLDHTGSGDVGLWQQHDWLSFEKGRRYAFRIWVRTKQEQELHLQILGREGFSPVYTGQEVIHSGEWQLWSAEFEAPMRAKGTRLQFVSSRPGSLWIGAVSVMPTDNFHGMRRDVIQLLKRMKPGNLRWPGGCFAEYYNWKEGLLPVDKRPPIGPHQWVGLLPDSDGFDNHEIGTDEFMALCRELGCDPHITTRYGGGGTIEEAASWVEYCNASEDTPWGRIRAGRGHKEPFGVKHWYVGNEIWGMSLVKNKDPELCADRSIAYALAMKQVDGSILLNSGIPDKEEWLRPQFERSGELFDMVQAGFYLAPDNRYPDAADAETIVHTPEQILNEMKKLRKLVDDLSSGGKPVGLRFYEWNLMWDRGGDIYSGVFAAEMLNLFCREADALGLALTSYFQPVTEGGIEVGALGAEMDSDGQVFELYAGHQGNRLLRIPGNMDLPIDICASVSPDEKTIFITLINEDISNTHEVLLSLDNFKTIEAAGAELLVPAGFEVGDDFSRYQRALTIRKGRRIRIKIPPWSVAGVQLLSK